ncbi:MAG: 2-hydroxyacid dehydrogenase, partial [Bacteroidetes bacterium]|nr:2-hydroxyacid dehydrogenase [Bacteroidota bacterium]
MKVAVFSTKPYDIEYLKKFNINNKHQFTFLDVALSVTTTELCKGFEAVCVFVNDQLNKAVIEQLAINNIKLIVLRCAGFNNVDIMAAAEKNIVVVRVPTYSPQAVAEHAVTLILTLNRKTHKAYNRVRENNFSLAGLMGFNLSGKTIGVIGTGRIGSAFCKMMQGFNCKIIAYDIKETIALKQQDIVYKSLEEVIVSADIISLHCPLTPQTNHLFNATNFSKMKKGAMLINTSRGGLVNTIDVINALKTGQLGYLGMDVYEQEENLFFNNLSETLVQDDLLERLLTFPNVLITP